MSNTVLQSLDLDKLTGHPGNPNRMSEKTFKKLVANIERTGLVEPLVVRPHPDVTLRQQGFYQLINGHHRHKALQKLGHTVADCLVWPVDDAGADVLLATLNRLAGSDILKPKIDLLTRLAERFTTKDLAKLLPNTKQQIEKLTHLSLPDVPARASVSLPQSLVFFVTDGQKAVIESALARADERRATSHERRSARADALAALAEHYLNTVNR